MRGSLLGYGQWWVLREVIPALSSRPWVGATVVAGVLHVGLSRLPLAAYRGSPDSLPGYLESLSVAGVFAFAALAGGLLLVMLALRGLAQALILRTYVSNARRWVIANVLGDLLGAAVTGVVFILVAWQVGGGALLQPAADLALPAFVARDVLPVVLNIIPALVTGWAIPRLASHPPSANMERHDERTEPAL